MARSSRLWELQYPLPFESYNLCQRANGSAKNFFNYVMCLISLNYFFATVQDQSDITGMKTHKIIKKGIARTFQTSSLFKKYSVIENVLTAFHLRLKTGIWSSLFPNKDIIQRENNIRERAIDILRFLRIDHLRYEIADNLSFGHQKLLGIAMALVLSPKLLMFDEPVGGLSEEETKMVIDRIVKIRTQNPDIAILLVEHNMRVIMGICERIIAMNFGIKIAEGTPDEIRHNEDVIKAYLGSTDAS